MVTCVCLKIVTAINKQYLLLHLHITVTSLPHRFMQVRLYSLAGHLQQHESAFTDQPLVVQRLPSKLSSLAWDHNQNVGLPSVALPFMCLARRWIALGTLIRIRCLVFVHWNDPVCMQLLLYDETPCSCDQRSIISVELQRTIHFPAMALEVVQNRLLFLLSLLSTNCRMLCQVHSSQAANC